MKIGLVGFGKSGKSLLPTLLKDSDVECIDVFDTNIESFKSDFGFDKRVSFHVKGFSLTREYDLLIISTPDNNHGRLLIEAISYGVDVFVEKPAVYDDVESNELRLMLSNPKRGKFTSNTILRTTPFALFIRDKIASGQLGEVLYFEAKYLYGRWNKVAYGWRGKIPDYSVILGGGIHMIDLICFLVNDFKGTSKNFRFTTHSDSSLKVKDVGISLMSLSKGHVANVSSVFASPTLHERHLDCYGDAGWFQLRDSNVTLSKTFPDLSQEAGVAHQKDKGLLLKNFLEAKKAGWPEYTIGTYPSEEQILDVIDLCLGKSH
jgi:predicted dehydrogenase